MADYNSIYTGAEIDQGVGNGLAAPTTYAPIVHDSTATTYGKGTDTKYGHLKLSSSTSSTSGTSGGIAATPSAVKAAYDLANGKQDPATTLAGYGITDAATADELGTFVRPNLLDNAYFVGGGSQLGNATFPINQRGSTSYSGAADLYTIDRWKTSNVYMTVTLLSSGLTISASAGHIPYLVQPIENIDQLRGKTVTLSVVAGGELYSATDTIPLTDPGVGTNYCKITGIGHVLYYSGSWAVRLTGPEGGSNSFSAAKLEIGPTQTLAHQKNGVVVLNEVPNYEQEKVKCKRFYSSLSNNIRFPTTRFYSGEIDFLVPVTAEMRTVPSIIGTPVVYSGSTAQTGFTFSVAGSAADGISIRASKSGHGLTDQAVSLQVSGVSLACDL